MIVDLVLINHDLKHLIELYAFPLDDSSSGISVDGDCQDGEEGCISRRQRGRGVDRDSRRRRPCASQRFHSMGT